MSSAPELAAPHPPRSPWQLLYGAAHAARRRWCARRARRLPRPVVSVGNLHWGGTGKTPLVEALARGLAARGWVVAILSRGYKRRGRGVRVVSQGAGPLLGPRVAGDEPVALASALEGVAVVVGEDRYEAGRQALERLERTPTLFVLDDGFSHLRLAREVDLLVFPADDPFAGGRLAPAGRLREPLASAAAADAVLLTGAAPPAGGALAAALVPFGFRGPGFAAASRVAPPRLAHGTELGGGTRVVLVTGIARPAGVRRALEELGYAVVDELAFGDHHAYPPASLEQIVATWQRSGAAAVVTTAKDHVKLLGRIEVPLAVLPLASEPEPAFWSWLERRLAALPEPP